LVASAVFTVFSSEAQQVIRQEILGTGMGADSIFVVLEASMAKFYPGKQRIIIYGKNFDFTGFYRFSCKACSESCRN
jgi:hypothetical protein